MTQLPCLYIVQINQRGKIMIALLKSKEAARYIGYSDDSMRRSRVTGKLAGVDAPKHIKIGGVTVRYEVAELDRWVASLSSEEVQNKEG